MDEGSTATRTESTIRGRACGQPPRFVELGGVSGPELPATRQIAGKVQASGEEGAEAVVLGGGGGVAPEVETGLAGAVVVARAGDDQVKLCGDVAQPRPALGSVVVVVDLDAGEASGTKRVLTAAACTYIAAALTSLLTLLYLIVLSRD